MNEIKIGDVRIYHEDGNVGEVEILNVYRRDGGTAYKLRANERLSGSRIVKSIKKDAIWESWVADNAGAYCGWYLE